MPGFQILVKVNLGHAILDVIAERIVHFLEEAQWAILKALLLAAQFAQLMKQRKLITFKTTGVYAGFARDAHVAATVFRIACGQRSLVLNAGKVFYPTPARHGRVSRGETANMVEAQSQQVGNHLVVCGAFKFPFLSVQLIDRFGSDVELCRTSLLGILLEFAYKERQQFFIVEITHRAIVNQREYGTTGMNNLQ